MKNSEKFIKYINPRNISTYKRNDSDNYCEIKHYEYVHNKR